MLLVTSCNKLITLWKNVFSASSLTKYIATSKVVKTYYQKHYNSSITLTGFKIFLTLFPLKGLFKLNVLAWLPLILFFSQICKVVRVTLNASIVES